MQYCKKQYFDKLGYENLPESRKKMVACIFVVIAIFACRLDQSWNRTQGMVIYVTNFFLFIGHNFHLENKGEWTIINDEKSIKRLGNFLINRYTITVQFMLLK